jgi:putative transposase
VKYDPQKHHRRSIRLKGYDYTQAGAYFITIVTQDRECLLGDVVDGVMQLSEAGHMVERCWYDIPTYFPNVELDAFVTMPNHLHGIIVIAHNHPVGAGLVPAQHDRATTDGATTDGATADGATTRVAPTVGDIVGAFKSKTTVAYIRGVKQSGWPPFGGRLWQRNYYEHIIRNDASLNRIRQYIVNNPTKWGLDRENPILEGGVATYPAKR